MSLQLVVQQLNEARRETQKELDGITQALNALGSVKKPVQSTRILSRAARERIAKAQRERWRKIRAQKRAA